MKLEILVGPTITRTRSYGLFESVTPGSEVTLSCSVEANPLDLSRIRWFKDDQELTMTNNMAPWEQRIEGNDASLISRSIRREDAGQYVCQIENPYGTSRGTLPLVVQCNLNKIESLN